MFRHSAPLGKMGHAARSPGRTGLPVSRLCLGTMTALHVTNNATVTSDAIAPGFTLTAQDGRRVSLASELAHGPAVLVFYRGYW
jgi:hypothetical protein